MPDLTYRPGGARIVAYGVAVVLVVVTVVIGLALPPEIEFSISEQITLALILGGTLALLHGVGRSRVVADDAGVRVRNGYRDHTVGWQQVEGFAMNTGAPWPTLVTTDDDRVMLFAIQASDGAAARSAVDRLRTLHAQSR